MGHVLMGTFVMTTLYVYSIQSVTFRSDMYGIYEHAQDDGIDLGALDRSFVGLMRLLLMVMQAHTDMSDDVSTAAVDSSGSSDESDSEWTELAH